MIVKQITNTSVEIKAPAKINLYLEVLNKRPDHFHNLNSVFQAVSLYDQIVFDRTGQPEALLKLTENADLPIGPQNLIVRAYDLMKSRFPLTGGLNIRLTKNIPIEAGLGGGSSDAAATIIACNILFELGLEPGKMAEIGAEIGSDVPFFFSGGQALVTGRGENIEPIELPTDYFIVLIKPPIGFPTAPGFAALKRGLTYPPSKYNLNGCKTVERLIASLSATGNDFESLYLSNVPILGEIKTVLEEAGAEIIRLSGSGPTIFGLFVTEPNSKKIVSSKTDDWLVYNARPVVW